MATQSVAQIATEPPKRLGGFQPGNKWAARVGNTRRRIDMAGRQIGRLTVIEPDGMRGKFLFWKCNCSCGNTKSIAGSSLRRKVNPARSCGCGKIKRHNTKPLCRDHTGKTFGRWKVLAHAGKRGGNAIWKCRCECGNERNVPSVGLVRGTSTSCGCKNTDRCRKAYGEACRNAVLASYIKCAVSRQLTFKLSATMFFELVQSNCHYCGSAPGNVKRQRNTYGEFRYGGIDRKENNRGYVKENVVPCCIICNRAKLRMSYAEFMEWIGRIKATSHPAAIAAA